MTNVNHSAIELLVISIIELHDVLPVAWILGLVLMFSNFICIIFFSYNQKITIPLFDLFSNYLLTTFALLFLKINLNILSSISYLVLYILTIGFHNSIWYVLLLYKVSSFSKITFVINNIVLCTTTVKMKRLCLTYNKANKHVFDSIVFKYRGCQKFMHILRKEKTV